MRRQEQLRRQPVVQRDACALVFEHQACAGGEPPDADATGRSTLAGKRWRWRTPCASRRSAPCWPAAGATSGARISSSCWSERPLIIATAPIRSAQEMPDERELAVVGIDRVRRLLDLEQRAVEIEEKAQLRSNGGIPQKAAARRRAHARLAAAAVAHARGVEQHATGPAVYVELLNEVAHAAHARALLFGSMVSAICIAAALCSVSYGLTMSASARSRAAPVNCERMSTPCSSSRAATNSFATRFMPSCRLET